MSDVMLHGVLLMPSELWSDDPIDVAQRRSRYVEASARIRELEAKLQACFDDAEAALASHRKDVTEECAKVCEAMLPTESHMRDIEEYGPSFVKTAAWCAQAIRALKSRELAGS